jgi:fructosamine-3-kinase
MPVAMGLHPRHTEAIEHALSARVLAAAPLSGGCVGEVYCVTLDGAPAVVAKVEAPGAGALACEGWMLRYLATHTALPAPRVLLEAEGLLVMEKLEGATGAGDDNAQRHAAELLAALHSVTADRFGMERDTRIGGLVQANGWIDSWPEFFAQRRLRNMADQARAAGRLDEHTRTRVLRVADRLDRLLEAPAPPSLVHGDVWSGNVLSQGGRITGFIDPALCYAHAESELAFITLFATFGAPFFDRYQQLRPIAPGFFGRRSVVYNLFPLLVHVRLFGGGYTTQLEASLDQIERW